MNRRVRQEATPSRSPSRFPTGSRRLTYGLVAATAAGMVAMTTAALPAAAAGPATAPVVVGQASAAGEYIVRAQAGHLAEMTALLRDMNIPVERRIGIIDAAVVTLPAGAADALRAAPSVASVTANAAVSLLSSTYDPASDVNSLYNLQASTKARWMWASGDTGTGIDVALVDSGVTPVAGLSSPGKIINGPDLTPESQNTNTRYLDTYGHGTHMAGIIAGHDTGVDAVAAGIAEKTTPNATDFLGVAPDARIVSVKVADAHGNSDVSQVIAGIDWVVQHAHDPGLNVRVLNLSFGTNSTQSYLLDPLAYAVEVAWRAGIVVVTSAGNSGTGGMTNPATDPFVIAVGADDTKGTKGTGDDVVPAFSSQGLGGRLPDFIAPGAHVQSLRVPGSYIDTQYAGSGAIDDRFFRGSGTSQAAAFVSGAVALLLQSHPSYTPDQIKDVLRGSAMKMTVADPIAQGQGLIMLDRADRAVPSALATQIWAPSKGLGTLEGSRGDAHLIKDGVILTGEKDINGKPFNATAMAAVEAAGKSWAGGVWNGSWWAGSSWAGSSWAGSSWAGSSWAGSSWAGKSWASGVWTGSSWAGSSWAGSSWAGSSWAGSSWAGSSWAGKTWADSDWS